MDGWGGVRAPQRDSLGKPAARHLRSADGRLLRVDQLLVVLLVLVVVLLQLAQLVLVLVLVLLVLVLVLVLLVLVLLVLLPLLVIMLLHRAPRCRLLLLLVHACRRSMCTRSRGALQQLCGWHLLLHSVVRTTRKCRRINAELGCHFNVRGAITSRQTARRGAWHTVQYAAAVQPAELWRGGRDAGD